MRLANRLFFPAGFLVLAVVPTGLLDRLPEVCLWRRLLGVRCLGCGMTHAFSAALHGDWRAALAHNPLVAVAFPLATFVAVRSVASLARDLRRGQPSI